MNYLKVPGKPPFPISKSYFTVGGGPSFDMQIDENECLAFALHQEEAFCEVVPGVEKIKVNGGTVNRATRLKPCDRIEWTNHVAVFLDDEIQVGASDQYELAIRCLQALREVSNGPGDRQSLRGSLERLFETLIELAGAEVGYLVSETGNGEGWDIIASGGSVAPIIRERDQRRHLLSDTILNEALKTRQPVYVESMVNHPWCRNESVLIARIFSVACLPLVAGDRVFGCAYLYTRTPGRSIRGADLSALQVLATQAALLLGMDWDLKHRTASHSTLLHFSSKIMQELWDRVERLAPSELSIVITGETGTGKELIAREIHRLSTRSKGPFVAINCGAIPSGLIESVLFGHVKGAFTGAHRDQTGKLAQANGGTLFLDEVGDLPSELQVKLLRALQEKEVEPIGGHRPQTVDFRVIAATHRDLNRMVADRLLREDLWYRLKGATIKAPPLRERGEDLRILCGEILRRCAPHKKFSESALNAVQGYAWPGNVRELEQVIQRAAVLAEGNLIDPTHLELQLERPTESESSGLKEATLAFTEGFIQKTLDRHHGNRSKAAAQLGISERTLYRLLSTDNSDRPA